jgi:DNA primase large subunit
MQTEPVKFSSIDFSKYPFLKNTSNKIELMELTIQGLVSPGNAPILARAQKRLENAILEGNIGDPVKDSIAEISSYPAALILAIATKNSYLKKRYALAEAKTAYAKLLTESKENILTLAKDFNWTLSVGRGLPYDFCLGFTFYLKNAAHIHGDTWKFVNQVLSNGMVFLNKDKAARLLQEEIKRRIEEKLAVSELNNLPEEIISIASRLTTLAQERMGQEMEEFPKVVVQEAFPPCINALYEAASKNHHLSHMGRFTLTSFLVNIGMSAEAVAELFRTFSDFNERLTRYQVEHIAGERGSGTKYTAPQCSILQTHNVCKNRDDLCRHIYHPLKYYQIKVTDTAKKENKK